MNARAWVFTLLVCMISLAGFGQTTSDLTQNSETKEVLTDVNTHLVSVVSNKMVLTETFVVTTEKGSMEVKRYKQGNCEYLHYSNYIEIVDLPEAQVTNRKYLSGGKQNTLEKTDVKNLFRNPRDGLRITML